MFSNQDAINLRRGAPREAAIILSTKVAMVATQPAQLIFEQRQLSTMLWGSHLLPNQVVSMEEVEEVFSEAISARSLHLEVVVPRISDLSLEGLKHFLGIMRPSS